MFFLQPKNVEEARLGIGIGHCDVIYSKIAKQQVLCCCYR